MGKIATSLKRIIMLDKALDHVNNELTKKEIVTDENMRHKLMDNRINIMKQLVMELNIFDGMAHNSDSILRNLVELENEDISNKLNKPSISHFDYYQDQIGKIRHLMDIKELSNSIDVFKELEDTLKGTGEYYRYSDWISRIKKHPDYMSSNKDEVVKQLNLIKFRKSIMSDIDEISDLRQKIKNMNFEEIAKWNIVSIIPEKKKIEQIVFKTRYIVERSFGKMNEKDLYLQNIRQSINVLLHNLDEAKYNFDKELTEFFKHIMKQNYDLIKENLLIDKLSKSKNEIDLKIGAIIHYLGSI